MDQKFPKMWVQGKQDLNWKNVSLINFACDSLKEKSLVFLLQEAVKPHQARSTRI